MAEEKQHYRTVVNLQPTLSAASKEFNDEPWKKEWQDMPDFVQEDVEPHCTITMRFADQEAVDDFARRLEQPSITKTTKSAWHPMRGVGLHMQSDKCWIQKQ